MIKSKSLRVTTIVYAFSKYFSVIVSLIITAVLSRILKPDEYGVVVVVTVFTTFFSILSDLGLGAGVIQNQKLSKNDINDIFAFTIYLAVLLSIFFSFLGIAVVKLYGNSVYYGIFLFLSLSVLFDTLNMIPNALLLKKQKFLLIGVRMIVITISSGVVAIVLALMGFKYYALIFQSVLSSFLGFIWNYKNSKLRFSLNFDSESIKKIMNFSFYQFLFNILNYFARNLDNILVGKIMGPTKLAYYDKGYRLMLYPIQNITYVINPILFPILTIHQENTAYIYKKYFKVVRILSWLGVFITTFCFWNSREIIYLFFGNQWGNSVKVFEILSLSVWPQLVSSTAGAIYQSIGKTKLMFRSSLYHVSISIVLIVAGCLYKKLSIVGLLVMISLFIKFFIEYFFLIKRGMGQSYLKFIESFRYEFFTFLFMMIVMSFTSSISIENYFISMVVKGSICIILFLPCFSIFGGFSLLKR